MRNREESTKQGDESKDEALKSRVSRRLFLTASSGAAAALAVPSAAMAQDSATGGTNLTSVPLCYTAFDEPKPLYSQNGEANLTLNVVKGMVNLELNDPSKVLTTSYNGQVPGPSIYVNPGDKIRISLNNGQVEGDIDNCPGEGANSPHCFSTTNIHFHGLHVSPSSICNKNGESILSSDDVLISIPPRKSKSDPPNQHKWCVWLPQFHAPGTHWYHAHQHGSTAIQVANGMVGAIIVREPTLEGNIVEENDDKVLIVQEVVSTKIKKKEDIINFYQSGGTEVDFLVNGRLRPTIVMEQGRVQRWRFINGTATPRGLMNLKLCKMDSDCDTDAPCNNPANMYLIAVDGISFYGKKPQVVGKDGTGPYKDGWTMGPGNRADFLVMLPAGKYKVIKDSYPGEENRKSGGSTQVIAYVEVQDVGFTKEQEEKQKQKLTATIPGTLPFYLRPIPDKEIVTGQSGSKENPRPINFFVNPPRGAKKYSINDQLYNIDCVNIEVALGTAEAWKLTNLGTPNGSRRPGSPHPFHIHVNPFQLVGDKIDLDGPDNSTNWRWWDTISVEPNQTAGQGENKAGKPKFIWHRFTDYPGQFVLHCHILIHEDQGMMLNVKVNGKGIGPCCSAPVPGIPGKCEIPFGGIICPPGKMCSPEV